MLTQQQIVTTTGKAHKMHSSRLLASCVKAGDANTVVFKQRARCWHGHCVKSRMRFTSLGARGVLHLPWVSSSNFLHAQQNNKEGAAHDELPPVEVGCPLMPKEVAQLLMYGIMPWEGDSLSLVTGSGRNDILRIAKQVLHLQRERQAQDRGAE